jgi:hypothetical protein
VTSGAVVDHLAGLHRHRQVVAGRRQRAGGLNPFWRVLFAAMTVGMIYPLEPLQYGLAATAVALFLFMRSRSEGIVAVGARPAA